MIDPLKPHSISVVAVILFAFISLLPVSSGHALEESSFSGDISDTVESRRRGLFEKLKEGKKGPWGT